MSEERTSLGTKRVILDSTEEPKRCVFCKGIKCHYCWWTGIDDDSMPDCYRLWKQLPIVYGDPYDKKTYIRYLKQFPRKYLRLYRRHRK